MQRSGLIVLLLLTTQAGLIGWQAWRYSPTLDEPAHLAAGISHWRLGQFDLYRVNPPLVRLIAALPMLAADPRTDWNSLTTAAYSRPEFSIGADFVTANGFDSFWYLTLARWACIPLVLLGGYYCFRWARDLYGTPAGIIALGLWCFCPNILGNGALITPDASAAALGVTAGYHFWRWLRTFSWPAALAAGFTLGLAELTKSTWIILFGLWPLLWSVWNFTAWRSGAGSQRVGAALRTAFFSPPHNERPPHFGLRCPATLLQLAAILLIGLYLLNLGYGFENSFQKLGNFRFISRALGGADAHKSPGNRFSGTWLGALPVPVPANYLAGIDVQRHDFEMGKWCYLRGERRKGGWWYFYLYGLTVKTPIGTLALFALACIMALTGANSEPTKSIRDEQTLPSRTRRDPPYLRSSVSADRQPSALGPPAFLDSLVVLAPALILLFVVSSQTETNSYVRYAIPVLPFAFVWTSQVGRLFQTRGIQECHPGPDKWPPRSNQVVSLTLARSLVGVLLLATVASSLVICPHSLSYFNELAGGPANGPAHLLDANIDWGQDLLEFRRWYDAHPAARPMHLTYFGNVPPQLAGLELPAVPTQAVVRESKLQRSLAGGTSRPAAKLSGWHAISVNELYDLGYRDGERARFGWLRRLRPVARAGWSIMIFHVTPEDIDRQSIDSRADDPAR